MGRTYFYHAEVRHAGLNKYMVVKAASNYELNQKVNAVKAQWNEQWAKKCASEQKRVERDEKLRNHEDSLEYANKMTTEAEKAQDSLDSILISSINPIYLNVEKLKDFSDYLIKKPKKPSELVLPIKPDKTNEKYNPKVPFWVKLSKTKYGDFKNKIEEDYENDSSRWDTEKNIKQLNHDKEILNYNEKLEIWKKDRDDFKENQSIKNNEVDEFIKNYRNGDSDAISRYYSTVLEQIKMPFEYDRQVEVDYNSENKMLIVDILLPNLEDLPNLKKVAYIKSKNEIKECFQTDSYMKKKYDNVIYQIVLQTLSYNFKLDDGHNFIEAVVLNGKVNTIDKSTGKNIEPYVLSINISKTDFNDLNLSAIDPKAWFKSAKGISAATFADITPVAPVVLMNREDSRFIDGYNFTDQIDETINLAAIDWQDFENLIRELFQQEFNSNGGEVKITQASRDGGVDAVAFDPDPIRGGKIVIQAKRYTNVVGVSAVRDLYGTVMNEGATKGILVTTSNYGNDAYNFASGKPLTLMNGANLLFLLEKHGHKARIDLKEAKEILNYEKQ